MLFRNLVPCFFLWQELLLSASRSHAGVWGAQKGGMGRMSESTLSAWSLSIHVPRGGCGGGSIPQSFGFAVLVYIFAKMYLNTSFMTSLGCSIGIHLPKMCTSTKFPMFSFVRGSNPRACTNT